MTFENKEVVLIDHDLVASMSVQCLTDPDNSPDNGVASIDSFLHAGIIEITNLPDDLLNNPSAIFRVTKLFKRDVVWFLRHGYQVQIDPSRLH